MFNSDKVPTGITRSFTLLTCAGMSTLTHSGRFFQATPSGLFCPDRTIQTAPFKQFHSAALFSPFCYDDPVQTIMPFCSCRPVWSHPPDLVPLGFTSGLSLFACPYLLFVLSILFLLFLLLLLLLPSTSFPVSCSLSHTLILSPLHANVLLVATRLLTSPVVLGQNVVLFFETRREVRWRIEPYQKADVRYRIFVLLQKIGRIG